MKKISVLLLVVCLLFTGCGTKKTGSASPSAVTSGPVIPQPTETEPHPTEALTVFPEGTTAPSQEKPAVPVPEQIIPEQPAQEPAPAKPEQSTAPETPQPIQPQHTALPSTGDYIWIRQSQYYPTPTDNAVLNISAQHITLMAGEEVEIDYTYTHRKDLRWRVSSAVGLCINQFAILRALKPGDYYLYVTDREYADVVFVTVTPVPDVSGDIWFAEKEITMMEQTVALADLKGDLTGAYAAFTSSDPKVVEASGGMLRAQAPGKAVITATHRGRKATLTVIVTRDPAVYRVDLEYNALTLCETDGVYQMSWYYSGTKTLTWSTSDPTVAKVDANGRITPVGPGVCEIFLCDNCIGEGCIVTVTPASDK